MKNIVSANLFTKLILITFILSIIFTVVRMISAPAVASAADADVRVKSDYVLMLLQCIFGVFAILLPGILKRRVGLNIPSAMIVAYAVFLFAAIYLGEVRAFYYRFPNWDAVLHTFSGAALGALGFTLISLMNRSETVTFSLSPFFISLFAFCFAVALGVVWEFYEYAMDILIGTNMQKYALETGEALIGQEALANTMKDLIVDALGAFAISVIGYIYMKSDKKWIERMQLKKS